MMDEGLYANLLEQDSDDDDDDYGNVKSSSRGGESRHLAVVLSWSSISSSSNSCRITVACRATRKRLGSDDPVKYTLTYFTFLDDARRFSHLDALLTRLAPLTQSISLTSTEPLLHLDNNNNSNSKNSKKTPQQIRRRKQLTVAMEHLTEQLQSRSDVFVMSSNNNNGNNSSSSSSSSSHVDVIPEMPKVDNAVHSTLTSLLGGEGTDRYVAYKGMLESLQEHNSICLRTIGFLLHQLNIVSSSSGGGMEEDGYELQKGHLNSHLAVDRTASECINLLPIKGVNTQVLVGGSETNNSIYGLLNTPMKSKMGSRLLQLWLRQPLVNLAQIEQRQLAVQTLVENSLERDTLREEGLAAISGMDLDALAAQLEIHAHSNNPTKALQSLYKLHLFATRGLPHVLQALDTTTNNNNNNNNNNNEEQDMLLPQLQQGLMQVTNDLERSVQLVEAVLDMEAAPRDFLVKASYHEHLGDIRKELDQIQDELDYLHRDMNDAWSKLSGSSSDQVRLESTDHNNNDSSCWQFRIPDTNASKLLQKDSRITVHRLLKNGVYFSTKELRQLGSKKQDLLVEYQSHQKEIVQNAMAVSVTYVPVLEQASSLLAQLDVLQSLAHVAAMNPHGYCKPKMTDSEQPGHGIHLQAARHPCVELQDNVNYIPNDISLIFGKSSFLLVTGPNMGGKSTYIRSLGAIIAMAQIGSYVPCQSAKINIVHHILARVGAGDMQDKGISTFMAEMLEASSILRTATKRSLIIVDELGRGTSTFDGFGLATAISEYIVQNIGCMTVFATHFHELTTLEQRLAEVNNCHVTAKRIQDNNNNKQKLTFLYEVRPGPCLESFGIQVAEIANVPDSVIRDAKRKAKLLENFDYRQKKTKHSPNYNDDTDNHTQQNSEDISSALSFLQNFKKLPFKSLSSTTEKKQALRNLLQ